MSTLDKFLAVQTESASGRTSIEAGLTPEQAIELAGFTAWMKQSTTMTAGSIASYRTYFGQLVRALEAGSNLDGPEFRHVRACGKKFAEYSASLPNE